MQPETLKLLIDILDASDDIVTFTEGYTLETYRDDSKCRAAVERKFEIIGEACARIRDRDTSVFEKIDYGYQIIGLRNRVIHGYDSVDDAILWDVITSKLDSFIAQVKAIANQ